MTNALTILWLSAAAMATLMLSACSRSGDSVVAAPDLIPAGEPVESLVAKYQAVGAYEVAADGAEFRVLVYRDYDTDHRIVVYRHNGTAYERFGAEFNLLGFLEPAPSDVCGGCIRAVHRESGDAERLVVSADEVDLVPENGEWVPVG